ncbi:MAG: TIGR03619 family F420-dependent LLM class oxidoreductase [Sphingomonadales bacterium]|nr:TIGR03619 family F420-dependent LLM class oxidoreductase [Sphingomonadales bacterium]
MKLGVTYPVREVAGDPEDVRRFVAAADALGLAHMMAPDHVLKVEHRDREPPLDGPYTEKDSFYDPFTLFAFAAALSDRLEFASGVLVLPQRQTALVAQQAADVDLLSRERLRLGVGIGWNPVEFAGLGADFRVRAKRIEEQIGLLRRLWSEPLVSFAGRFDAIDRACINPRPRRAIPIWLGGYSEPAYRRGASLGDGFIFAAPGAEAVAALARVAHHRAELGLDMAGFGTDLLAIFARDLEECVDHLARWREAGGSHGTIDTMSRGLGGEIGAHIDFMAEVQHRLG